MNENEMRKEGFYYIVLKTNNEFQIRHLWEYKDRTPDENMQKINNFLSKNNRPNISLNKFKTYAEANEVLNQIVPYTTDGLTIDYELRKFYKYIMSNEQKKVLNELINEYIENLAFKKYNSKSREGLKIKLNHNLKEILNEK